jgi:diphosphomevalonate decarboxylase
MSRGVAHHGKGRAVFEAAPNIALVKYWGMRDPARGLPYNSSLSLTLDRMRTRTAVCFDPMQERDELILNGERIDGPARADASRFLDYVRERSGVTSFAEIRSSNNFPTASGLASSASGFAALAGAGASAAGLRLTPRALSQLARLGSGSASRSIFGGFVEWRAGTRPDGRDCYAHPIAGPRHWPSFRDVVVLIDDAPSKKTRSAEAMQSTVRTSPYYHERLREIPGRLARIRRAISLRDARTLFPLIMEECDSFRSVCETTVPSLDYLTASSRAVLAEVRSLNDAAGRPIAAYTHDAGAHVHVFALAGEAAAIRRRLRRIPGVRRTLELSAGAAAHPI